MKKPAPGALRPALLAVACAVSLCAPAIAPALTFHRVILEPGLLIVGNTDEPSTGPTPLVLAQSLGVSVPLRISGPWFFEPAAILFGTWYEYTGTRAVPGASESGDSFFVLGTLLAARAGAEFSVSKSVSLGVAAGLDLLVRFPVDFAWGAASRAEDRRASLGYFYGGGRFLYPETSVFLRWALTERFGISFSVRGMHPVFHLWDGEDLPYLDQLLLAGQVGFSYTFR
jgi:hypothetical protein